ncbi:DNA internalization-related competence protein ComEC/Rec2 [Pseudoduganella namucuonensis]|uniref:Competence protein ComEC n=1 Tax=Pseudoduganella namucuonensis TaxID=1035707 RepID=A0A1I7HPQ7_9BURK|nr:DNA internalization-related competence protein ComEC/Rec2 [Pseudoduganella namucuonensis]SFU62623.1 competence protein ComEC [Pseudoduganella namucuonensis]
MARCTIAGFVAGAAWLNTQASLPPHIYPALAAVAGACMGVVWLMRLSKARPAAKAAVALVCGALLGYLWAALVARAALEPELAAADEGRNITLIGTVDNLPNRSPQSVRFNFAVEQVVGGAVKVPPRVALSWYSGLRGEQVPVGDVRPGERWRLTVRLQRPHGNANPHGFDYELWLLEQGVRATGYVRQEGPNARLAPFAYSFSNVVERCRAVLRDRILRALEGKEYAGVIVALVIGDQRAISQSDWQVFNRTGIAHLVSISGLHITMIAGLFALAASWLWRRSFYTRAQLPLLLPAQKVAAIAGLLAALAYVLLAGFGVPAQRTLYMLAVIALALWLDRLASISHILCLAAGVTVLFDPWAVMWPGFWLSYGAVAAILYATAGRTHAHHGEAGADPGANAGAGTRADASALALALVAAGAAIPAGGGSLAHASHAHRAPLSWRERLRANAALAVRVQAAVTLGLVPLTMLLFSQISLISPVANAIAIPVVSLLVTPLALAGSLLPEFLAGPVLTLAHGAIWLLAQALQWMSASSFAAWSAPAPPPWVFCLALAGTAWMLAPRGWPVRWLGAFSWIPLLAAAPSHPAPAAFRAIAFDVGQGMAVLIETGGHRLLYDTGPSYTLESNGGNRVILPYLRARGITALDGLVVSHSDADHAGGALPVLEGVEVGWAATSLAAGHPVARAAARHVRCAAGQGWTWDGVRFEFLHPDAASYGDGTLKPNARSCVLKVGIPGRAMLLAGDIEAAQEAELLARDGARLRADILLAPHHGSGTSSTEPFLRAVSPEIGVFQVGHRNRYHHPQARVYERYGQLGIRRLRTDQAGAVEITVGPDVRATEYRRERPRYWHGR